MLTYLRVRNLAVLRDVMVEFGPGLNVLTGETGAGKSLLVDAVGLLMGDRADAGLVRKGAERGEVEGQLQPGAEAAGVLRAAGLDVAEGDCVVRREISAAGGHRVFVNGRLTTLAVLRDLAGAQLALHGQNRHLTLAGAEAQRRFLDAHALPAGLERELAAAWRRLAQAAEARAGHAARLAEASRRLDMLRFQLRDIEAVDPAEGEDAALRAEERLLATAEERSALAAGLAASLVDDDEALVPALARCAADMDRLAQLDPGVAGLRDRLEAAVVELEDIAAEVRGAVSDDEEDAGRLGRVQDRLAALQGLCRKYGGTLAEVRALAGRLRAECSDLEDGEGVASRLEAAEAEAADDYDRLARRVSRSRRKTGRALARQVRGELGALALAGARLEVATEDQAPAAGAGAEAVRAAGGPGGYDRVRFLFTAHAGEEPGDLARIASGGELSRLMLALTLVGEQGSDGPAPRTFIFDEVDAGVGGDTARAVGERLRRAAVGRQVICVTHLPQVAALAARHLHVSKESMQDDRADSRVRLLEGASRVEELARMLGGGSAPETARKHALALLEGAAPPASAPPKSRAGASRRGRGRSTTWA